jgi:hypothetical protein
MRSAKKIKLETVVAIVTIVFLAPLLAVFGALVGPYATLPVVAVAAAIAFIALPLNFLLLTCLIVATLVAGLLDYFGGISQAFWLPYLMGALFALRAVAERLRIGGVTSAHPSIPDRQVSRSLHPVTWLAAIYFATAVFGLLVAKPPLLQVVVATKNYFFMWGLLLVLLWGTWRAADSSRFWSAVVVVACLQWPVVLYQRFVVAARRSDASAWDSIVGTFGGNPEAGGQSAAMALVCCLAIVVVIFRMREKKIKPLIGMVLLVTCLLPIALAEVKAAFVWLLVAYAVLFAQQIARQPVRAVATLLLGAVMLGGLGLAYMTSYQEQRGGATSLQEFYDKQIKYSLDPNEYRADRKRLGRTTALVFWWERHDMMGDPASFLLGHGIGASRSSSSLGSGEVAKRLPFPVDNTAASVLLWDVGLLGTLSFVFMLASAGLAALRLSQRIDLDPAWRESTTLATCVLVMVSLGLLYNKDAIDNPSVQLLLFFAIAQVMLARRQVSTVDQSRSDRTRRFSSPAHRHALTRATSR